MRIIKENVNLSALIFYIFILIPFDYIFFGAYIHERLVSFYARIVDMVIIILEIIILLSFSIRNIYRIELSENGIEITYKLKKIKKSYAFEQIQKVRISNSQRNSMHNINFYFDDNSKFSLPASEKEVLKKVYHFFKDKNVDCKVLGLPAGRTPEDYNW